MSSRWQRQAKETGLWERDQEDSAVQEEAMIPGVLTWFNVWPGKNTFSFRHGRTLNAFVRLGYIQSAPEKWAEVTTSPQFGSDM